MKTIYIVDDNLMMREFLKSYFQNHYDVKAFSSGEEALANINHDQVPSLLLLDYEMEGLTGEETLQKLKSSKLLRNIPVMFLSGKQKSDIRIACLKGGAKDFISKPFNPVELKIKVDQYLLN